VGQTKSAAALQHNNFSYFIPGSHWTIPVMSAYGHVYDLQADWLQITAPLQTLYL